VGLLRMDPEVEGGAEGDPVVDRLRARGWRHATDVQPHVTRIVDLTADEDALWADLRKKSRQYVNKARSSGIVVREVDPTVEPDAFETFHRVMVETSQRAGIPIRTAAAYRDLWAAFAPSGESDLRFAEDPAGTPLAVLLTVRCGSRVVEPYGGMTEAGRDLRANYLLKWEAIRRSRDAGATSYDMWGLVHRGIAQFKEGFGGREVSYIGAWDIGLDRLGATAIRAAEAGRRTILPLLRGRVRGSGAPGGFE
jgi:peptidoglycan pentaglycine glycine transferase (the first glycine)